jgi:polyphosphate kinase 2 (PPK2 family)
MPRDGEIGIFNRSHYEDVLAARVRRLVPKKVWTARYPQIVNFEDSLVENRTTVVKFFLHISKDEQKRRLEERLEEPDKRWKFRRSDLDDRALWKDYQAAYGDALARTSTKNAPWYVIPANHKWYRNWVVSNVLIETLQTMKPRYPDPPDLDGVTIN